MTRGLVTACRLRMCKAMLRHWIYSARPHCSQNFRRKWPSVWPVRPLERSPSRLRSTLRSPPGGPGLAALVAVSLGLATWQPLEIPRAAWAPCGPLQPACRGAAPARSLDLAVHVHAGPRPVLSRPWLRRVSFVTKHRMALL